MSKKNVIFLNLLFSSVIKLVSGVSEIVVTNHPKCTQMAKDYITKHDVTPPELAIIISVCESIVNPQDAGLGGGFQAVIYNGQCRKSLYLNSREVAPAAYDPAVERQYGKIGVPSMLKGYEYLYNMTLCGVTPALAWKELFTQNIQLAKTGWTITNTTKRVMTRLSTMSHSLEINSQTNIMKNPKLSKTLEIIANEGPSSSLYKVNGFLHNQMMADMHAANSFIQSSDLLKYDVKHSTPFPKPCLGYNIATTRIPGSGSTFIMGCKIVEAAYDRLINLSYEKRFLFMYHTIRYMYSLKPYLRSKHFNLSELLDNTGQIANDILNSLDRSWDLTTIRTFGNYKMVIDPPRHRRQTGTTNIIIKRAKYAISMTSTINWSWGSKLYSDRLGIFYNNQLNDFGAVGEPNGPMPEKQPQSAISALILYSNRSNPVFQIGSAGGSKIIGSIFNTFFNYFVNNMTLLEANSKPRCIPKYSGHTEKIYCESEVQESVKKAFHNFNMQIKFEKEGGYAAVTACSTLRNRPEGAYDIRRGGEVYINTY